MMKKPRSTKKPSAEAYRRPLSSHKKGQQSAKKLVSAVLVSIVLALGFSVKESRSVINSIADTIVNLVMKAPQDSGNVTWVSDGDTLSIINSNNDEVKVRLYGVDAPELSQMYGAESKKILSGLVSGRDVSMEIIDIDQYGRAVSILYADNKSVNESLLKLGAVWYYDNYCNKNFCKQWQSYADDAKTAQKGLWQHSDPTPPWQYRHSKAN